MTVYDFFDFLDQKYDFSSGMDFDNVGLLVGDGRERVTGVLVCLDCTDEAINEAVQCGANLIINLITCPGITTAVSFHPFSFGGGSIGSPIK